MKKIEAIIRPSALDAVCAALTRRGVEGLTVAHVAGVGREPGHTDRYRGAFYHVDLLPRVRVELVVTDVQARPIAVTIIEAARTGRVGDGLVFITPVDDAIRIRTAERGVTAISTDGMAEPDRASALSSSARP
jgi:nitrogen regulatory protein P-II 1